jgi:hypothetical protein
MIALVADVHVGNHRLHGGPVSAGINRRCEETLDALRSAVTVAEEHEAATFIVLGDLFDTDRPNPQIITATARVFCHAPSPLVMLGNHDRTSDADGDHAIGPLEGWHVDIASGPTIVSSGSHVIGLLPFRQEPAKAWFRRELEQLVRKGRIDVVGVHFGLHDAAMRRGGTWVESAPDAMAVEDVADAMRACGVRHLFAGNWHEHRAWVDGDLAMVQVGALVPTGWDNPGLDGYGSVALYGEAAWFVTRMPGPRFVVVRSAEELAVAVTTASERGDLLYVRWLALPAEVQACERVAVEMAEAVRGMDRVDGPRGALVAWEVLPDLQPAQEAARQAGERARARPTATTMLEELLQHHPLPDGIRRERVGALVRQYLEGSTR